MDKWDIKIALIGSGKTGSQIIPLVGKENIVGIYNTQNPVENNLEELSSAQVIVVFVPGQVALPLIPFLLQTKRPVVWGSTGLNFPEDLHFRLQKNNCSWIYASNFSLGMALVRPLLQFLGQAQNVLPELEFHLREVHHIHKKDAPSGTALSWRQWLGQPGIPIESQRLEDTVGIHQLTLSTDSEEITLAHVAKNRALFARGALLAARTLVQDKTLASGLIPFEKITKKLLPFQLNE